METNLNNKPISHIIDEATLSKLTIGQTIANYRELCLLLGKPVLGGEAKKSQLKQLDTQITFRRDKYKYIIEAINPYAVLKGSRVTESNKERMVLLLRDALEAVEEDWEEGKVNSNNDIYKVIFTLKELFLSIGVCGEAFEEYRHLVETGVKYKSNPMLQQAYKGSIFNGIPYWDFIDFYGEINTRGREVVSGIIKTINSSYLATIEKVYMVVKEGEKGGGRVRVEKGTDEQYQAIRAVINEVLNRDRYRAGVTEGKEVKSVTERDIFLRKKSLEFYKDVCRHEWFKEHKIIDFYTGYEVIYTGTLSKRLKVYCGNNKLEDWWEKRISQEKVKSRERTSKNIGKIITARRKAGYEGVRFDETGYRQDRDFMEKVFYRRHG